jgi:hypothetical protein
MVASKPAPKNRSGSRSDAFARSFEDSNLPNAQPISSTAAMIHYDRDVLVARLRR